MTATEAARATASSVYPSHHPSTLSPAHIGMLTFLVSEVAFFSTLIVTYIVFIKERDVGPYPRDVLSIPLVLCTTACLLTSSGTVHLAEKSLHRGARGVFLGWWAATIVLGALFLLGTAYEWYGLIVHDRLTISRNMFGTTFFTLVGFHAAHVTVGVLVMVIVLGLALRRHVTEKHATAVELTSWYWHFVDGVWVVVFVVVYLIGR